MTSQRRPSVNGPRRLDRASARREDLLVLVATARLLLDPVSDADIDPLLRLFHDAEVRRYLCDDALVSRDWVEAQVRASTERFAAGGVGLLLALRLGSAAAVRGSAAPEVSRPSAAAES